MVWCLKHKVTRWILVATGDPNRWQLCVALTSSSSMTSCHVDMSRYHRCRHSVIRYLRMAINWGYCSNDTVRTGVTYPGQSDLANLGDPRAKGHGKAIAEAWLKHVQCVCVIWIDRIDLSTSLISHCNQLIKLIYIYTYYVYIYINLQQLRINLHRIVSQNCMLQACHALIPRRNLNHNS